ncbi:MAG: MFS transporter [Verrucomicrobia bacterium]|nr:MFS transporter [Verrucomicrobiota bacterium]
MLEVAETKKKAVTRQEWVVVFLLFLAACINYIDRGSLSMAAPLLAKDLSLSPVQMGLLFSGFFWSYAAFQIPAGWLVDRFSVFWVFAIGFVLWSVATLCTGFATTLAFLFVLRLLLGAGESVAFPSFSKVIAIGFPIERRALPNALLDAGTKIGPAIGTLFGGLLVANYGWRMLFFVLGVCSLIWVIPWLIWAPRPRPSKVSEPVRRAGPSLLEILSRREAWGTFIGAFCYTYAFFFLLTWLPSYLVNERHVSLQLMGILSSVPFWGSAVAAVVTGWASDRWIGRGGSPTRVRKTVVVTGLLLSTVMLPAALVPDISWCIVLLSVAYVAFGIYASNHWAISQTLAGPDAAGKWSGIQNTIGGLSGIIAPLAAGLIVATTGSFFWAFLSPAVLAVVGAASYLFLVGPVSPLTWRTTGPTQ